MSNENKREKLTKKKKVKYYNHGNFTVTTTVEFPYYLLTNDLVRNHVKKGNKNHVCVRPKVDRSDTGVQFEKTIYHLGTLYSFTISMS